MSTAFSGVYCDQGSDGDGDEDDSSIVSKERSVRVCVGKIFINYFYLLSGINFAFC
jgi:hypothetical protein